MGAVTPRLERREGGHHETQTQSLFVRGRDRGRSAVERPVDAVARAQQDAPASVSIGDSDLGGVVSGPSGPEAGVWVIAETTDLPTKFAKIVVTDDQGRYVLPELPKANYSVWVRGYGLVDSPKVATAPGKILNLSAVPAPSAAAAAEYYPAIYWYSMLKVPDKSEFPGTGPQGNGMPTNIRSQAQWLDVVKTNGCYTCHQLGNKATRTIPKEFADMKPEEAWARRIMSGQAQVQMANAMGRLDVPRALKLFADWTDRIAAGELPAAKPTRPQGAERNIVISVWDWSDPKAYLHDEISTDKRKPTVNAYGKIYGVDRGQHRLFPRARPQGARGDRGENAGARSQDADIQEQRHGTLALLGRGGDLGQPGQHAQSDDG